MTTLPKDLAAHEIGPGLAGALLVGVAAAKALAPHLWRFLLYQPVVASIGVPLQQRTKYLEKFVFRAAAPNLDPVTVRVYADRFRDPVVARTARQASSSEAPVVSAIVAMVSGIR